MTRVFGELEFGEMGHNRLKSIAEIVRSTTQPNFCGIIHIWRVPAVIVTDPSNIKYRFTSALPSRLRRSVTPRAYGARFARLRRSTCCACQLVSTNRGL